MIILDIYIEIYFHASFLIFLEHGYLLDNIHLWHQRAELHLFLDGLPVITCLTTARKPGQLRPSSSVLTALYGVQSVFSLPEMIVFYNVFLKSDSFFYIQVIDHILCLNLCIFWISFLSQRHVLIMSLLHGI